MAILQFRGEIGKRGLRLLFYLVDEVEQVGAVKWVKQIDREPIDCTLCDEQHPQLYAAWRRPAGTFGSWIVFRYLGQEHIPDLSIPISVKKVPRGAEKLSVKENSEYWHA